jgi:chemotaxis signal transduction protein
MLTPDAFSLDTQARQLRQLRQVFDAAFAVAPPPPEAPAVALLLVRAGGELCAVRRAEMTGFGRGENLAPTPGRSPGFLGLTGVRGGLYPVWSLAVLLGRSGAPAGAARWLVLAEEAGGAPCAFACEAFEKMVFLPSSALDASAGRAKVMARWGAALVPVVDLPSLLADIRQRQASTQPRSPSP